MHSTVPAIRSSLIIGAWELVSYVVVDGDGKRLTRPLGDHAQGLILYTADGFMSAQLMRADRPLFDRTATAGGTTEQTVSAAHGYLAYTGRYDLDVATSTLRHHVAVSLLPNWLGTEQIRHGELHAGRLVLSGDVASEFGAGARAVLTWQRPRY